MSDYPPVLPDVNHTAPVPRRIRAVLGGRTVLDTTAAMYLWEWPRYPQYYVPFADLDPGVLVDEKHERRLSRGTAHRYGLRVGSIDRPGALHGYGDDAACGLSGYARIDWGAVDAWYEEDEQVFVHPRDPYVRVDALRSSRRVRIELEGAVLAESTSPVLLFETGLPTRYYLDRTDVDFTQLRPSDTITACPYKGTTTGYWSAHLGSGIHRDIAWAYDFTTLAAAPIAGLVAFYNDKVDIELDGRRLPRPETG